MQVQVNTDDNVEGRNELAHRIEVEINNTLGRFSDLSHPVPVVARIG